MARCRREDVLIDIDLVGLASDIFPLVSSPESQRAPVQKSPHSKKPIAVVVACLMSNPFVANILKYGDRNKGRHVRRQTCVDRSDSERGRTIGRP